MTTPSTDNPPPDRLRPRDVKTLALAALGGALEFYDFVVFVFFAIPLSHLFFPPDTAPWLAQLQVFGIFAAGYLARPLGGIVMAHYGDKLGRWQARKELASGLPLRRVFERHLSGVLLSMLVTWMLTAAIVVVILMTPTLVQSVFHVEPARAFLGNSLASLALALGCLFYGALTDRVGYARALLCGAIGLLVCSYALYLDLQAGAAHFLVLYTLAGFSAGVTGVVPTLMVAAFPPAVRFSGLSFSYNIAYALFGGLTPPLTGWLVTRFGVLAPAHYVAFTALVGAVVAVTLLRVRRSAMVPV